MIIVMIVVIIISIIIATIITMEPTYADIWTCWYPWESMFKQVKRTDCRLEVGQTMLIIRLQLKFSKKFTFNLTFCFDVSKNQRL